MSCNTRIGNYFRFGGHNPAGQRILCDVCEDKQSRYPKQRPLEAWSADTWEDWDVIDTEKPKRSPRTYDLNDW